MIPLRSLIGDLDPMVCKLHCAVYDGEDHPIDVLAHSWQDWVRWNSWRGTRDDFNRQFIFSLGRHVFKRIGGWTSDRQCGSRRQVAARSIWRH